MLDPNTTRLKQDSLVFALYATPDAKKLDPKWKELAPILKAAAKLVLREVMPTLYKLELGVILQSDEELRALNIKALHHDYYTDILTFEIDRGEHRLQAELYLSLDRARENALRFKSTQRNELTRLVIHGMLHLAGYNDKLASEKKRMQRKERYFLEHLSKLHTIE